MTAYVVLHDVLGAAGHRAGEVVEFTKNDIDKMGVDVQRLLGLGAMREATDSEAQHAVKYGDAGAGEVQPFPAVPYAPTDPDSLERQPGESAAAFKKRVAAAESEADTTDENTPPNTTVE